MIRALYVIVAVWMLSACVERAVCPAFQSAYIYDKEQLRKKFSYFQEDSTPKVFTASKNQYLVAEATPYRKKIRSMQTVPRMKVFVNVPDSISGVKPDSALMGDLDRAARSVMDTTMIVDIPPADTAVVDEDSAYVITRDKEVRVLKYNTPDTLVYDSLLNKYVTPKPSYYVEEVGYNVEQDNYMWYLRHSLVLPDVRLAKMHQQASKQDVERKERKKEGGFFGRLFKNKTEVDIDSAELDIPAPKEDEFDFIDTTKTLAPEAEPENGQERKGLFKTKRKREQEILPGEQEPEEQPARRKREEEGEENEEGVPTPGQEEQEGDDGF